MPSIYHLSDYFKKIPVTAYIQQVQKPGKSIMKTRYANIDVKQTLVELGTGLESSPQPQASSLGDE